jgi:hypothetical protein
VTRGLYDSLFHSNAVVGLNTSAMIEAGILGKPVHTVVTEEFAGGQEETIHFGYLRASSGGLSHEARGLDEHVTQLTAALRDEASATAQTRRFIERFVRPRGWTCLWRRSWQTKSSASPESSSSRSRARRYGTTQPLGNS